MKMFYCTIDTYIINRTTVAVVFGKILCEIWLYRLNGLEIFGFNFDVVSKVKYRVRSPKFIWAPCEQLYSLAETLQLPSLLPAAFGLIYEGGIGQPR